ncbi:hypothetical protein [Xanthomonas arboricola]|uniref:hypothetical protein n=1 Tax=Xanthomonas arboricola TaxID=56448 RepID=UPI0011B039B3|nr:hypothetical protein [Xanthomonas arboricola]
MKNDEERLKADTPEKFFLGGPLGRDVNTLDKAYYQLVLEESRLRVAQKKAELQSDTVNRARPQQKMP